MQILPKDFAHARELKTTLDGAVYRVTIPRFVYEGLIQSQMKDLAVFNANGEIVPFVVTETPPVTEISARPDRSVPFYELPPDARTGIRDARENSSRSAVGPLDIYVKTGADGQVIAITGSGTGDGASSASRDRRYLLDFSSMPDEDAEGRRLHLSFPEDATLTAVLSLFKSPNLRDWSPILRGSPLIRLSKNGERLTSDSVELPEAPGRYILLQVEGVDSAFNLKDIRYSSTVKTRALREESASFEGKADVKEPVVEYDTLGAFPIASLNFELQEPGLYRVRYFSRPDTTSEWTSWGGMELAMIREPSGVRLNPAVSFTSPRGDRYWRIQFESSFSGTPPKMKIAWRTSEVFFLAQGSSPYILAFGSPRKDLALQNISLSRDRQLSALDAEIGPEPHQGSLLAPGGEEAARGESQWQRYLVWGLLVFGGLLLSAMAWKLMKSDEA
jgi:hypothetical protein